MYHDCSLHLRSFFSYTEANLNAAAMTMEFLGAGQSGVVFKLAPKVVAKYPHTGREVKHDVKFERKVYERLGHHPSILSYPGSRGPEILLEYHPRGTLRQLIESNADIFLFKWVEQIVEGLDYLHGKGIIHCDTSTSNVLTTDNSDAVLCDFAGSLIDGQRLSGSFYGQRCLRRHDYSFDFVVKDDLFALGSVIYEMSTRKRPYDGKNDEEVRQLYKEGKLPDVLGIELGNIINKCWHADYESAAEVLVDIRKVLLKIQSENVLTR